MSSQFYSEWRAKKPNKHGPFRFDYRSVTISVTIIINLTRGRNWRPCRTLTLHYQIALPELGSLRFAVLLPRGVRAFRYGSSFALVDVPHDFLLGVPGLLDDVIVGHTG